MYYRSGLRAAMLAVLSVLMLGACKGGSSADDELTGDDSLMRFVPADTPYLLASGEPLPDDILDRMEPRLDEVLRAYQGVVREIARAALARNASDMGPDEMQRVSAVIDELTSLMSIEGLRKAGIERGAQGALYGNGLLPVLRIEVSDEALFDAAIARIEEAAGETMSIGEIGDEAYRYVGDDEARLVIGTFDGTAVFTLMPSSFDEAEQRSLLGLDLPTSHIGETGTLSDIMETYGYSNHFFGFVDGRRIASTFIDGPSGLDVPLLATSEFDASKISAVCRTEVREIVDIAPRVVFGYDEIESDQMSGSMVVELRPDLARELTGVTAAVPGLGRDPGGLVSFGMSINLLALREFYEARLDAMETDPFECEYFADLQAGVEKGRQALNQPIPPIVYAFRGFNAVIDGLGDYDMASGRPPEDIDASVLIAVEDAQTMLAMGAMFSPELAGLELKPDGKPVRLDLPQVQALGKAVYAAMLEDAVALSIGADAEQRVSSVLAADAGEPPPLFAMTMDAGQYYKLIGEAMMTEDGQGDEDAQELSREAREALRDAMLAIGEMYDRMTIDTRFTERGLVFDSSVSLKE